MNEAVTEVMTRLFDAHPEAVPNHGLSHWSDGEELGSHAEAVEFVIARGWATRGPDGLTARDHWLGFMERAYADMRLAVKVCELDPEVERMIGVNLNASKQVLLKDIR